MLLSARLCSLIVCLVAFVCLCFFGRLSVRVVGCLFCLSSVVCDRVFVCSCDCLLIVCTNR